MNKSILIIDTPMCCNECSLMFKDEYSYFCPVKCDENKTDLYDDYIKRHKKPDWCPLKKLPRRKFIWNDDDCDYQLGYNDCLNDIKSWLYEEDEDM